MSKSNRISNTLLDPSLYVPGKPYKLEKIYDIVEKNTTLDAEDLEVDSSCVKWKHMVRSLLEEKSNGQRSINNTRTVQYKGDATYIFS